MTVNTYWSANMESVSDFLHKHRRLPSRDQDQVVLNKNLDALLLVRLIIFESETHDYNKLKIVPTGQNESISSEAHLTTDEWGFEDLRWIRNCRESYSLIRWNEKMCSKKHQTHLILSLQVKRCWTFRRGLYISALK